MAEPAARVAGLISGEYDIITTLTPDDMALIGGYEDLQTRGTLIENVHMVTFNFNQPIFQSKALRRAMLRHAIEFRARQHLIKVFFLLTGLV